MRVWRERPDDPPAKDDVVDVHAAPPRYTLLLLIKGCSEIHEGAVEVTEVFQMCL